MWDDGSAARAASDEDGAGAIDDRDLASRDEDPAGWVSMKTMSQRFASVYRHGQVSAAWDWLVMKTENNQTPEIAGRPVRMSIRTIRGREWWCMHEDDARRVRSVFSAFVSTFQSSLVERYGRYDRTLHPEWSSYRSTARALGIENPETLLSSVWQHAQREHNEGRTPRIGEHAIRVRYFALEKNRAFFIHRDDVALLDPRRYEAGSSLTLRDVVDHFRQKDDWMGLFAERMASELRMAFRRTGTFSLRGIPLATVRIPTEKGLAFRLHPSSLPVMEKIVAYDCDSAIREDLEEIPEFDVDTDSRSTLSMSCGF